MKNNVRNQLLVQDLPEDLTSRIFGMIDSLPSSTKVDYLKEEIFSKYVSAQTDPPLTRRVRAISKWLSTERENEATNDRLLITPDNYKLLPGVTFHRFVEWCRDFIRNILGDTLPVDALIGSFSGGASTSRSRTWSQPCSKYLGKAHITGSCLQTFYLVSDEMPGWLGTNPLEIEETPGSVMFTVPKKTDIDRVACKEPDLNMFFQKGLGNYISRQLRRVGINLNDQSINRSLAQKGSEYGTLATLDLSSASDSISEGLVALLLPVTWYTFLDSVRSHVTIVDGEEHRNHMFSSMGNGFTFELESLLFFTLAKAVAHFHKNYGIISVYGDDIICPVGLYEPLVQILEYFGFSVNTDKSFYTGPFRESCGGHYHNGSDITPFYIQSPVTSYTDLIHVANQLRAWASSSKAKANNFLRTGNSSADFDIIDLDVEVIWLQLKRMIPECLWGGHNPSFKYQLVSEDPPFLRIQPGSRKRNSGVGGYYHWLNATWARTVSTDGVATSEFSSQNPGKDRLRKVRDSAVPQLHSVFLHEIG